MDITGKIIWCGERRGGTSASTGKSWASQDFVVEATFNTPTGISVQRVAFNVFGTDKLNEYNIQMGDELTVHYGVSAREYQGKWYNEVRAYKVEKKLYNNGQQIGRQQFVPSQQGFPPQQPQMGYQSAPINTVTAQANPQQYTQQVAAANYGVTGNNEPPF